MNLNEELANIKLQKLSITELTNRYVSASDQVISLAKDNQDTFEIAQTKMAYEISIRAELDKSYT